MGCGCGGKGCQQLPKVGVQTIFIPDAGGSTTPVAVNFRKGRRYCFSFFPIPAIGSPADVDVPSFLGRPYQSCVGVFLSTLDAETADPSAALATLIRTTTVVSVGCGIHCFCMADNIESLWISRLEEGALVYWECSDTGDDGGC